MGLWTETGDAGVAAGGRHRRPGALEESSSSGSVAPGRLLADFLGQRQAVLVRQLQIEDHGVERVALGQQVASASRPLAAVSTRHAPLLAALRDDARGWWRCPR